MDSTLISSRLQEWSERPITAEEWQWLLDMFEQIGAQVDRIEASVAELAALIMQQSA